MANKANETDAERITRILRDPNLNKAAKIGLIRGEDGCPNCKHVFKVTDKGMSDIGHIHNDPAEPGADARCLKCGTTLRLAPDGSVKVVRVPPVPPER